MSSVSAAWDSKMKTWISIALMACVCFFGKGDAVTGWSTPPIDTASGAGGTTITEDQELNMPITTYVATGGTAPYTYSIPTAVAPFAVSTAGVLTITAAIDFDTTQGTSFEVVAVDSTTGSAVSGTATITVAVTNVAPTFSNTAYSACVLHNSGAGTTVTTVTATDAGSDTSVTYGGVDTTTFVISTEGVITVAADVTLDQANSPYEFKPTATDGTAPTTSTVTVTVADSCSSAVGVALSMMTLLAAMFVNMF